MKRANCGQAAACTVLRQLIRLSYKKINYAVSAGRLPARSTHPSYFVQSKCIRNRKSLSKFSETDKLFSILPVGTGYYIWQLAAIGIQ